MEWWILQRWRQTAPNTPDWITIWRVIREATKPDPKVTELADRLKAERLRLNTEIAGYGKEVDNLRKKLEEVKDKLNEPPRAK